MLSNCSQRYPETVPSRYLTETVGRRDSETSAGIVLLTCHRVTHGIHVTICLQCLLLVWFRFAWFRFFRSFCARALVDARKVLQCGPFCDAKWIALTTMLPKLTVSHVATSLPPEPVWNILSSRRPPSCLCCAGQKALGTSLAIGDSGFQLVFAQCLKRKIHSQGSLEIQLGFSQ